MKKIVIIAAVVLAVAATIICLLIGHIAKPADEVMTGPINAEHVLTKELTNYGYSVSRDVQERAENIDRDSLQKIQEKLSEIGIVGKERRNLAEACALMCLSESQIVKEPAAKEEVGGLAMTDFKVKVNDKTHTLRVLFDIDKNETIREISDENGNELYGFDKACVLFALDINSFYA